MLYYLVLERKLVKLVIPSGVEESIYPDKLVD